MAGTATPELVFTATTDAVQWVQIYGLTRLTDANDGMQDIKGCFLVARVFLLDKGILSLNSNLLYPELL